MLGAVEFISVTANVIPIIIKPMMLLTADNRKLESKKAQRDGDP